MQAFLAPSWARGTSTRTLTITPVVTTCQNIQTRTTDLCAEVYWRALQRYCLACVETSRQLYCVLLVHFN